MCTTETHNSRQRESTCTPSLSLHCDPSMLIKANEVNHAKRAFQSSQEGAGASGVQKLLKIQAEFLALMLQGATSQGVITPIVRFE